LLLSKEKQEQAEKRAGASSATGVRLGALNEALKNHQTDGEEEREGNEKRNNEDANISICCR
jgi:hypothetical protein